MLPDDVADRMDAALRTAAHPHAPAAAVSGTAVPAPAGPASERPAGHPGGSRRPPDRSGRRTRRVVRWGSGLAVAAALVVVAALGLDALQWSAGDRIADGPVTAERDHADDAPAPQSDPAAPELLATGSDYRSGQLPATPGEVGTFDAPPDAGVQGEQPETTPEERDGRDDPTLPVPLALRHLWPLPAECHSAIVAGYDHAASIDVVDFATVDGDPALVAWLTTGDGQRWVSVVGPGCGSPAVGADELHRTQVG